MASLSRGFSFGATEQVTNAKLHALVDSGAVTDIVTADIQDSQITDAKISAVSGSKFITLANTPSGAGKFPIANLPFSADGDLGTSDTLVPTQKAVKTYVDAEIDGQGLSDDSLGTSTRGDILYYGESGWVKLAKGTNGQYLTIGANDPAWTILPNKLGVAFSWSGSLLGKFNVGGITYSAYGTDYAYVGTISQSYDTVYNTKYRKVSGVNTIIVYVAITGNTDGNHCKVTIGNATALELSSGGIDNVFTWKNGTIDVSGLSDGTVYDVTVQLKGYQNRTAKMAELIGFGS
jgi:hypothetical protein